MTNPAPHENPATPENLAPSENPTAQKRILQVEALHFGYGDASASKILSGVDMHADTGELVCILGPNGCGKTTLLKCIIGLLCPECGNVAINSRPPDDYSPRQLARLLSYVPQASAIAFDFTVAEVVRMGRSPHMGLLGVPGELDLRVCRAAMEMTDTLSLAARRFASLSGGEKQTVMIARALAQQPQIMLLDEPTSSLDLRHQLEIYAMMARLARDWNLAVVCVSHDVNLAARFADRLVMLSKGRVAADGRPAEVIQESILREVYGVQVRLIDAQMSAPLVLAQPAVRK